MEQEILELISTRTGLDQTKINKNMEFEHDLNMGRDEFVAFINEIEKKFNTSLPDEKIMEIKTVSDLEELLLDHLEIIS